MSCFERDTIVYAANATMHALTNATQKCQDAPSCETAYCALSLRSDAEWICFSASFLPPQTRPPDATWVLYVMLALFLLYGAVITVLYVREKRSKRYASPSYDDLAAPEFELSEPEQPRDLTQ